MTSESFQRVIGLYDLPNVVIRICDKDFFINQTILHFISPELNNYFSKYDDPFTVAATEEDQSNSLFESDTCESLVESCSIFISFLGNGTFLIDSILYLHIPSLILFSKKIFYQTFLSLIIEFSISSNKSTPSSFPISFDLLNFFRIQVVILNKMKTATMNFHIKLVQWFTNVQLFLLHFFQQLLSRLNIS
jgi:hypothetical protein